MPTLLSVDIWDTLLRRRCHPDEVKLFTARMLWTLHRQKLRPGFGNPRHLLDERVRCEEAIATEREAVGLDNEYAVEEVFARWIDQLFRLGVPAAVRTAIAERLVEAEVEQEQRVVYPDRRCLRLLQHHEADRMIGLSDFYLGEHHLHRIIESACGGLPFERVFVSADCLVNKMRGRLFAHAQREMIAEPRYHTHIGDNEWSDVKSPKRFGVRAIHYLNPDEELIRARHRSRYEARRKGDFVPTGQVLTRELREGCEPPADLDPMQRELYEIGVSAAPVYVALALAAMQEAHALGCPAVHYCTREGEFFKRIHEAIAPIQPFGLPAPRAELLEVSRVVTFMPSLREVSTREMMRVWNLYSVQSIGQLLRTLDVNPLPFEPLLARHGIDPEPVIKYPWKDRRVQQLFADPLFARLIEQQRDRRRVTALEYLHSKGFGNEHAVMVDVGWRGTIQDNLAHLLPETHIAGWYLGLVKFLNDQPPNTDKHAVGPDARLDPELLMQIIYNVSPLEMIANTDSWSVKHYERGSDGSIVATRIHDKDEDHVWQHYTQYFQQGALGAAPIVARWARTFAVDPHEMKPIVIDLLRTLKDNPPRVLAEAYFALNHNETFGVGGFLDKRADLPAELLRKGEESRGSSPEFVAAIESSDWPQGLLRLLGHDELCRQYNAYREDRSRKIDTRLAAQKSKQAAPRPIHTKPVVKVALVNSTRASAQPAESGATP